jgi:tRNA-Thr(GGU) m(6)t(6)A37 methyltransferase TsaA
MAKSWRLERSDPVNLKPIGRVKSPVIEPTDELWGGVECELELDSDLAAGLQGIESFSHLIVIFFMHQARFDAEKHLVRRPQGREDMPELGILAQRAKHRPNPIGITAVKLLARQGNVLRVKGLDAIDGTPVLDIKPYFPVFDRVEEAAVPDWVEQLMAGYF